MGATHLSSADIETIRQCLAAAVHGPFFPDRVFQTLIRIERDDVAAILDQWPGGLDTDRVDLAVNNVLNNLLGYPHRKEKEWSTFISVTPEAVAVLLARWRGDPEFEPGGLGYFNRLR